MHGGGGPSLRVQAAAGGGGGGGMSASMPSADFPAKHGMGTMIGLGIGALVVIVTLAALLFR
jgi:hypothetical protein